MSAECGETIRILFCMVVIAYLNPALAGVKTGQQAFSVEPEGNIHREADTDDKHQQKNIARHLQTNLQEHTQQWEISGDGKANAAENKGDNSGDKTQLKPDDSFTNKSMLWSAGLKPTAQNLSIDAAKAKQAGTGTPHDTANNAVKHETTMSSRKSSAAKSSTLSPALEQTDEHAKKSTPAPVTTTAVTTTAATATTDAPTTAGGIPCHWDAWMQWETCTRTCGTGTRERTRKLSEAGDTCDGNGVQTEICNTEPCPQDCKWNEWSPWGSCSESCGTGTSIRIRNYAVRANYGGLQCTGDTSERKHCTIKDCPIDCLWGDWGTWSPCDHTCGNGSHSRERTVQQQVMFGGRPCVGERKETETCSESACPVDCEWGEWEDWGACSDSCGGGESIRQRIMIRHASGGGEDCQGSRFDTKECGTAECPKDCAWNDWEPWKACKKTCGNSTTYRERTIAFPERAGGKVCAGEHMESKQCEIPECPVDCQWGQWSVFNPCDVTCGGGIRQRVRKPAMEAKNGGAACDDNNTDSQVCNTDPCPVDCQWSDWQEWDSCTKSCGNGTTIRNRKVLQKAAHGGKPCSDGDGPTILKACNTHACPINCEWSVWGDWSECPRTCGGGEKKRVRSIITRDDYGGQACIENDGMQKQACGTIGCPMDCEWSSWGDWSECSKPCGHGNHSRSRSKLVEEKNEGMCIGMPKQWEPCFEKDCPIDCKYGSWEPWGGCTKTCGDGHRTRTRPQLAVAAFGGERCPGNPEEVDDCNIFPCPVDCAWDNWSLWGSCSKSCGTGERKRSRVVRVKSTFDGLPCEGASISTEECATEACPRNCKMAHWSEWTPCTRTCGGGDQFRERTVVEEGANGGQSCDQEPRKINRPCNVIGCPQDCSWTDWKPWGKCSATCGSGAKTRYRKMIEGRNKGAPCDGDGVETDTCTGEPCSVDCQWEDWKDWEQCDVTCGTGTMLRHRVKQVREHNGKDCEGENQYWGICVKDPCESGASSGPSTVTKQVKGEAVLKCKNTRAAVNPDPKFVRALAAAIASLGGKADLAGNVEVPTSWGTASKSDMIEVPFVINSTGNTSVVDIVDFINAADLKFIQSTLQEKVSGLGAKDSGCIVATKINAQWYLPQTTVTRTKAEMQAKVQCNLTLRIQEPQAFMTDDDARIAMKYAISHQASVPPSDVVVVSLADARASLVRHDFARPAQDEASAPVRAPLRAILVQAEIIAPKPRAVFDNMRIAGMKNMSDWVYTEMQERTRGYRAEVLNIRVLTTDLTGETLELIIDENGITDNQVAPRSKDEGKNASHVETDSGSTGLFWWLRTKLPDWLAR